MNRTLAILATFCVASFPVFSFTLQPQWEAGFSLGLANENMQNNAAFVDNGSNFPAPSNNDQYALNHTSNTNAVAGIYVGARQPFHYQWLNDIEVGLRYQYFMLNQPSGNAVIQYSLPQTNNYNFTVSEASHVFTLFSKIHPLTWQHFSPFMSIALGVGFNLMDYIESPKSLVTPRVSPNFTGADIGFVYGAGFGMDYYWLHHLLFTGSYEYLHLGNATGEGQGSWSNTSLNFGRYTAHLFSLSISYLFS